jgi:class 3 adenylate cyclase
MLYYVYSLLATWVRESVRGLLGDGGSRFGRGAVCMDEAHVERRLAAILVADIAGYSRLMAEDEAATVAALKGHQAVVLPLVDAHGGAHPGHRW